MKPPATPLQPDELVSKILNGEKNEFRHLIKMFNQPLYRIAIIFLKNGSDAEDVLQTTYLKAFVHLSTFRRESSFLTWITRILINECKMLLRLRKPIMSIDHADAIKKTNSTESVMDSIYKNEIGKLLEQTIQDLPEKYRLVYLLREVNEVSTEETSTILGLTTHNVKIRLHRAKTLLRANILQHIPAKELFPFGNTHCSTLTEKVMTAIQALPIVEWS